MRIVSLTNDPLTVVLQVSNQATGKRNELAVSLTAAKRMVTLGQSEGVEPEQGDMVTLHADGYADFMQHVP